MFSEKVRRIGFSEANELSNLPRCGIVASTPLRGSPFSTEIFSISLGDVLLQIGRSTPVALLGKLDPDTSCLVLPDGLCHGLLLNGMAMRPDEIAVYAAGAEHESASHGGGAWAVVMLQADTIGMRVFPPRGCPILRRGTAALLRVRRAISISTAELIQSVREVLAEDPSVFEVEAVRMSLRCALLDAVHELLAGTEPGGPEPIRRGSAAKRRVVRAADDYIRSDPAGRSDAAGLSVALGVPLSRLRAAFSAVLAVEPSRYSHLRRLAILRTALLSMPLRWTSVADAGKAHGFASLDSFLTAYFEMFGEDPMTTLEHARHRH